MPRLRVVHLVGLLVVVGLLGLLVWRLAMQRRGSHLVGQIRAARKPAAPPFDLTIVWRHAETWPSSAKLALADDRVSPLELKGHPTVVNFWASWCIPCKHEAPRFVASASAHEGRVTFLGVDVQDFKSDARRFSRRFHVNYVSVRDGSGSTYEDYGLTGVPETYWLDGRGRIVAHSAGEVSLRELERGIAVASRAPTK